MSEQTITCRCGEQVPAWTRFHWTSSDVGHYVEPDPRAPAAETEDGIPANLKRASRFWSDASLQLAPSPGAVPPKPWPLEEELRRHALDALEQLGWDVYDLEQGYRTDGSSRVALGIADAYAQHEKFGERAWIEFKRWDNEPSPEQVAFALAELAAGGTYLLIYEVGQLAAWHAYVRRTTSPTS